MLGSREFLGAGVSYINDDRMGEAEARQASVAPERARSADDQSPSRTVSARPKAIEDTLTS